MNIKVFLLPLQTCAAVACVDPVSLLNADADVSSPHQNLHLRQKERGDDELSSVCIFN